MFALSSLTAKFASLVAAVAVTSAMLGSIDSLASTEHAGAAYAANATAHAGATQVATVRAVRGARS